MDQVLDQHMIVRIEVGVVVSRCVLDRVLNELEARNAQAVKRNMVRAAGVAVPPTLRR